MKIAALIITTLLITGCSNLQELFPQLELMSTVSNHPLKTKQDLKIEKYLISGSWTYQRQADDCDDTTWAHSFYKNRYYKSGGSACLLADAFSVDAENWHVKNRTLYITNLSPLEGKDIILKYGIDYLDKKKLVLTSGIYKYTFLK